MKKHPSNSIYDNSIVFIGPIGVGKTLISRKLESVLGLPVVSTDLLRHCPHQIKDIEKRKAEIESERKYLKLKISACSSEREKSALQKQLYDLNAEYDCRNRQIEMRLFLGDTINYEDMGYDERVANNLLQNFGEIAWHFYQKKFEFLLLKNVINALPSPCILDLGGGMSISLENDYKKLYTIIKSIDRNFAQKHLSPHPVKFREIKELLKPFKSIIYLKLPFDYKDQNSKSSKTSLNAPFISSGQYNEICTHTINTNNLFENDEISNQVLSEIVALDSFSTPKANKKSDDISL